MDSAPSLGSDEYVLNSEIVPALGSLAIDDNMDGMKHALVLETYNATDRSANKRTFSDSSKTKAVFIDIDEETPDNDSHLSKRGSLTDILDNMHSLRNKGKEILDSSEAQNEGLRKIEPHWDREWLKVSQGASFVTISGGDILGSAEVGDGVPSDPKGKALANSFCQGVGVHKGEETISPLRDQSYHENAVGGESVILHNNPEIFLSHHGSNSSMTYTTPESKPKGGRHHKRQKHKTKRKHNSFQSQLGEWSSSSLEVPEISCFQSSNKLLKPKSARQHSTEWSGESSQPVSEVGKANFPTNFQEESCSGDNDPSTKLSQLESDEKLARQLQQLYDYEQPGPDGSEETDVSIAWSLQQGEASNAASAKRYQSHPRDASMAHLYVHSGRPSFREYSEQVRNRVRVSSSRMTQSRRNFHGPEMDLEMSMLAELRRNFGGMDPETLHIPSLIDLIPILMSLQSQRAHFLEALEAAFENDQEMEFEHDFYTDDYEMLLTLDDDNFQHSGASESQINSLPESVIQGNSREEACAICLESPNAGDVIRHLPPCLHKFHKECIDTWLRRKMTCPVCKSGIF